MDKTQTKEKGLIRILEGIGSCVIAFSGGLDSAYLAVMASEHVKGRVLCVTLISALTPETDTLSSRRIAAEHGLEHTIILMDIPQAIRRNPDDRCYLCKLNVFRKLGELRAREELAVILDGENSSDAGDDRPGSRAARECGIRSPLAEAGLTKAEIRQLAQEHGISVWDRPASACLATRIPTGTSLDDRTMHRVDMTEDFIRSKGIRMIRARVEPDGVRLELGQDENTPENRATLAALETEIKDLGWATVEIDPTGYVPAGLRRMKNVK